MNGKTIAATLAASLLLAGTPAVFAQKAMNPQTGQVKVSPVDAKFMVQAAQSDMTEIKTSQLALDKSQNSAVRDFAQRMIDEHTKSSSELKPIAERKNVTLAAELAPKQQALYDKLSGLSGEQFDRAYMQGQQKAHSDTEALFSRYLRTGRDADPKAFARKVLPVVQKHERMAADISSGRVAGSMDKSMMNKPMTPNSSGTEPAATTNRTGPAMGSPTDNQTTNPASTPPASNQTNNTKDRPYPDNATPTEPK